jgi:hypothetical protein
MLVVAAPEDSQPGTPLSEGPPPAYEEFGGAAEDHPSIEPDHPTPRALTHEELDYQGADLRSPITAVPVLPDEDEDDDGYAGWMDNAGGEEEDGEYEEQEPHQAAEQVSNRASPVKAA